MPRLTRGKIRGPKKSVRKKRLSSAKIRQQMDKLGDRMTGLGVGDSEIHFFFRVFEPKAAMKELDRAPRSEAFLQAVAELYPDERVAAKARRKLGVGR